MRNQQEQKNAPAFLFDLDPAELPRYLDEVGVRTGE
jgi:hypothetical protein